MKQNLLLDSYLPHQYKTTITNAKMNIRPISLEIANNFVKEYHRHHQPVQGHKFSIGLYNGDKIIGVAIAGRPVARLLDDGLTLEITRLCTDGTKNACSQLYSRIVRIAKEMGYKKVITYILETENGASLKASNFKLENASCGGGSWNTPSRKRIDKHPLCKKQKWSYEL